MLSQVNLLLGQAFPAVLCWPCMGATASIETRSCHCRCFFGGGRRNRWLGLTHAHLILALQWGLKAINDMGMAHLTSEAGFTCLKRFGKIIFGGFL